MKSWRCSNTFPEIPNHYQRHFPVYHFLNPSNLTHWSLPSLYFADSHPPRFLFLENLSHWNPSLLIFSVTIAQVVATRSIQNPCWVLVLHLYKTESKSSNLQALLQECSWHVRRRTTLKSFTEGLALLQGDPHVLRLRSFRFHPKMYQSSLL